MKKILAAVILGWLGTVILATSALASTFLLTPANTNVEKGRYFILRITVEPQNIKTYTVKAELKYPSDLLEVKSFTFAASWMQLNQPGYSLTDNANGILVKTAGFPGGFSEPKNFGIVSFLAKKAGNGIINITNNSIIFNETNQNVLGGPPAQSSIIITAPVPPPEKEKTASSTEDIIPPAKDIIPPEEETLPLPEEEIPPPPLFDILTQPAAKQSGSGKTMFIFAAIAVPVLIITVYYIRKKRKVLPTDEK